MGGGSAVEELVGGEFVVGTGGAGGGVVSWFAAGGGRGALPLEAAFLSASHCSTGICPGFSTQHLCPRN